MRQPSRRAPRRSRAEKLPTRHILRVLTEGKVTEPSYLYEWARRNRQTVRIELDDTGMTPDALVRRAREYMRSQPRKHADRDFDEIWCVFRYGSAPELGTGDQRGRAE